MAEVQQMRAADMVGAILWRDQSRATEYFSKWIELKEKMLANDMKSKATD